MTTELWHYARNESAAGPVGPAEIMRLIRDGVIGTDTPVWRRGLPGWESARQHFDFGADAANTPPPDPMATGMSERARRYVATHRAAQPAPATPQYQSRGDGLYRHAPGRGFGEAIGVCLSKYFTFSGRASRSEYWYFILFHFLIGIVSALLDASLFGTALTEDKAGPLNAVVSLGLLFPFLAVSWRRLHDIGRSGWWIGGFWLAMVAGVVFIVVGAATDPGTAVSLSIVLGIGAVVYGITMLVFLCTRGDPGPNHYG